MKIIDPHLHLFDLKLGQYNWLNSEQMPAWFDRETIYKDFTETDLKLSNKIQVAAFVHIEAGFDNENPWRELEWLESINEIPFKSIAGIELSLSEQTFKNTLERLRKCKSFVGVRHILETDPMALLSQTNVINNLSTLVDSGCIFELQMPLYELEALDKLIPLISRNMNQWVITHCGLPPKLLSTEAGYDWLLGLHRLSQYDNVSMKCSGWEMLNTEQDFLWPIEVVQHCLQNFGEDRVMLASNFPLCLFQRDYQSQWEMSFGLTSTQMIKAQFENAYRVYNFSFS